MTMNLFRRSNQNGAPSESARAVIIQPRTLIAHACQLNPVICLGSGGVLSCLVQPIGSPSLFISAKFILIRHSGVSPVTHGVGLTTGVGDSLAGGVVLADGEEAAAPAAGLDEDAGERFAFGEAAGVAAAVDAELDEDGVGVGLFLAYSVAAATNESRIARSVESFRTSAIESTLSRIESASPINKMMSCDLRLYVPETRSMALSNQFSMFCRTFSGCGLESTKVIKAFLTGSGREVFASIVARRVSIAPLAPGPVAPCAPPSPTRSIRASAKFRAGM